MKQRFRAKRDRYASRIYVNDEYYNRYFISDNHKSLSEAKRQSNSASYMFDQELLKLNIKKI